MKRLSLGVAAACTLVLAGCGSATHQATKPTRLTPGPSATRCVPGNSFMGCSLPAPAVGITPRTAAPSGRRFVDVSDWQPSVDWHAVKASGIFAVVVKAGEGTAADSTYASHVAGARAAGLQVQAYWFVRPVGCAAEAAAIRRHVPAATPLVLDIEVPGTSGYATCLRSLAHAVYTSPGTWPGGSTGGLPLWQAEYGPALHPDWRPIVGWQFSATAPVPGIPSSTGSDESVDYGLFAAPGPVDIGGAQHYERYPAQRFRINAIRLSERNTVRTWDARSCSQPARRAACKSSSAHLRLLLGRDQAVYRRQTRKQRDANHTPGRIQGLVHRLDGRGIVRTWL